jgi:16S rRNA G966 N2-methylase RsmD
LYAGSGAVGIEAVSRGAGEVWMAENAPAAIAAAKKNLEALGIAGEVRIETRGVKALIEKGVAEFDFVYIDPPYEAEKEYAATLGALGRSSGLLAAGAVVIAEHAKRYELAERYGWLVRTRVLLQGDAGLSFYSVGENAPPV